LEILERYIPVPDWITLLVFSGLIFISLAKMAHTTRFNEFVQLVFTNKYFVIHGKGGKLFSSFNLFLFVNQVIAVSIFIFMLLAHSNKEISLQDHIIYIRVFGFYALFVAMKYYLEKLVAHLFSIEKLIDRYLFQKLTYRNLISLLLLVINLVFLYTLKPNTSLFLIVVMGLIILNIAALTYSYKTHEKQIRPNFFYFILYLCALEISPYYILYKIFL
jgi:hypothetical protein